jgi:acetyl-CoA carboxylase alpha subunit
VIRRKPPPILWRDGTKAQEAANSMKITAQTC